MVSLVAGAIGGGRALREHAVIGYVEQYGETTQARLNDVNRKFDVAIYDRVECQIKWLPDRPALLLTATPFGRFHHVMLLDISTGDTQTLTRGTNHNEAPSLSPDGDTLLYAANQQRENTLYLADLRDPAAPHQPLTTVSMWVHHTRWSPDGRYIAAAGIRNNRFPALAIIDNQTSSVHLYEGVSEIERVNWSAAHTRAARIQQAADGAVLYTHDTTTDAEQVLLRSNDGIKVPAWSPDGEKIAFVRITDSGQDLWLLDVATGERHPLTAANYIDITTVQWSPDGRQVAFAAREDDPNTTYNRLTPYNLYTVSTSGDVQRVRRGWGAYVNHYSSFCAVAWMP